MRAPQLIAIVHVAVAVILTTSGGSNPTAPPAAEKTHVEVAASIFSDRELDDLVVWASQNESSLVEAVRQFSGQMEFMRLANALEASRPELFVEAEWIAGAEPYGVVRIVGDPVAELAESFTQTKADVRLESGYRLSSREFDEFLEAAYRSIAALVGGSNVTASGSPSTATIEILVNDEAQLALETAVETVEKSVPSDVRFTITYSPFAQDAGAEGIVGGRQWGQCTAGFSVRRGTVYGMTTANHCSSVGGSTAYQGTAMSAPTAPIALSVSSGDIKWRRTVSTVADPRFQAVTGGYRLVSATLNPVVGTAICKYGVTTGQTCSTVASTSLCANDYCGLSRVSADISEPGDSGGPWFFGNTAMGIHHGTVPTSPLTIASGFTRIGGVNALNLVVLTG